MASFALTEALQMLGLWRVSGVCLPQALDLGGSGLAGEEGPPRASFYPNTYSISGIRVVQKSHLKNT